MSIFYYYAPLIDTPLISEEPVMQKWHKAPKSKGCKLLYKAPYAICNYIL